MTTPEQHDEQAIIPPHYLVILALVGLLIALVVAFTQPTFSVVGWGGLGITVLSLVAWVLMAPEQAKAFITGRTVRFGGASLLITGIVLVALIALYVQIRAQEWRVDLTERDTFSLTQESRQAIAAVGADPTVPEVKITAFYGAAQAGQRDRDALLFEDYRTTSAGKIAYEFVDPDRNPALASQLEVNRPGQIYVARVNEEGALDTENGELVNFFSQDSLTNAILKAAAGGDFRAYFIQVNNGLTMQGTGINGMSTLTSAMRDQLDWNVQEVALFELTSPESDLSLNDPEADGEVMIIPGGDTPLTDSELEVVTNYVDNGGELIILAAPSTDEETTSLSTGEGLSEYLWQNFGMRFNDDVVIDLTQSFQSPLVPFTTSFNTSHYITTGYAGQGAMLFELPHSIEIAEEPPENVVVEDLTSTTDDAFAKTDFQQVANQQIEQSEDDPVGPFVLAAAAENTETGARVVLFGSTSIFANSYSLINSALNLDAAFNSLVWTTGFDEFFTQVNIQSAQRPQDTPMFIDQQTGATINLLTTLLIPFGILAIGVLVWWNNRETAR